MAPLVNENLRCMNSKMVLFITVAKRWPSLVLLKLEVKLRQWVEVAAAPVESMLGTRRGGGAPSRRLVLLVRVRAPKTEGVNSSRSRPRHAAAAS